MSMLEITFKEQDLLGEILQNAIMSLRREINHTDHMEYREMLKERMRLMESLEPRLEVSKKSGDAVTA